MCKPFNLTIGRYGSHPRSLAKQVYMCKKIPRCSNKSQRNHFKGISIVRCSCVRFCGKSLTSGFVSSSSSTTFTFASISFSASQQVVLTVPGLRTFHLPDGSLSRVVSRVGVAAAPRQLVEPISHRLCQIRNKILKQCLEM